MTQQEFNDKVVFTADGHYHMGNQYVITASSINTEPPIIRQTVTKKNGKPHNEYFIGDRFVTFEQLLKIKFRVVNIIC